MMQVVKAAASAASASAPKIPPTPSLSCPIAKYEVGSYKELLDRAQVGDDMQHDHIPSFASLRESFKAQLGRDLKPEEALALYQNASCIELPTAVHKAGRTFGGKNNVEQIAEDAKDLGKAAQKDMQAYKDVADAALLAKQLSQSEYDKFMGALAKVNARNKMLGLY
jgi:hypothetical protein